MSEPDTPIPTPALNHPTSVKIALRDVFNFSSAASRIVTQEFGCKNVADAESNSHAFEDDEHALIFDNPFANSMDGDDDDDI
ncbi:hypothetical protein BO78DRAFT_417569 [Aspergillus sclerotiicarbonarius CBS 121057]|uniref:Uncharacterized protein n=1 Tax=Aspergillus sclerotiicarbonarius (strain CBS 121057 / IBT 28362) TaxID=1448318 RepID=A0A319EDX1_ASPSB|nr:hypothetical protein BO78DRAFT_417569 [Aspergillus sclerotiicarbonarius CBS 121057]